MSSVWGIILHWGSTIKVSTEHPVATRHHCDMTEKLLKVMLNLIKQQQPCMRDIRSWWGCSNKWHLHQVGVQFICMDHVKRIWYLSPTRAAKVQASLRIRAVLPERSLLAHISSESRGTFRQKARSLASLNGWACAVKICHAGMLEDTNSLDRARMIFVILCVYR